MGQEPLCAEPSEVAGCHPGEGVEASHLNTAPFNDTDKDSQRQPAKGSAICSGMPQQQTQRGSKKVNIKDLLLQGKDVTKKTVFLRFLTFLNATLTHIKTQLQTGAT